METDARRSRVVCTRQLIRLQEIMNRAADELTNKLIHRFDPDLRAAIHIEEIQWETLPGLVNYGIGRYDEGERARKRRCG